MNKEMNNRLKQELYDMWTDWKAITAGLIVVIPIILYTLNHFKVFSDCGTWEDIKYIVTGPLLIVVGIGYAPVWITCLCYLIYLIPKFIFTVIRLIVTAFQRTGPKTVSRKELIERFSFKQ